MIKKRLNLAYYFWFFILLVLIPISSAFLAEGLTELVFLKNGYLKSLLKNGTLNYGYPYYLSLPVSLAASMLVVAHLRKRFMIYNLEKSNLITLFWIIVASYLLTQHIQIYFFEKWWIYSSNKFTKNPDLKAIQDFISYPTDLYLFVLPHLLNAVFVFFGVQILIGISDIESSFKVVRLILRKVFFSKEELEKIIDYTISVSIWQEKAFKTEKELFLNQKTNFTYQDYKTFLNKVKQ